MSAPWWSWLPEAAAVTGWAWLMLRGRRPGILRRRAAVSRVTDDIEAHVAVGSLSGTAPSDVQAYVLLVLTGDGKLKAGGTASAGLAAFIVATTSAAYAQQALAGHGHDHGSEQ
jgi:hypothetical protein